jgi:hypothetical protein
MKVVINHQFSKEKAIKCAGDLILTMTEKYKDEISDLKHETIGNTIKFSLKARGMKFKGEITIEDHEVIIESKLPFALKIFEGILEKKILENADKVMAMCK